MAAERSTEASLRGLTLRYAAHLGYRSVEEPLFRHAVGSADPVQQAAFAARRGFRGMQYALACSRPVDEQTAVAKALAQYGLETGCVLYAPFESIRTTTPGLPGEVHQRLFLDLIKRGLDVALRVGSSHMVVLPALGAGCSAQGQRQYFAERLQLAADLTRQAFVQIVLEPLRSAVLPPLLLTTLDEALSLIRTDPAAVRLAFDTGHVQLTEGNAAREFERVYEHVSILQLADVPNRQQPGTGEVDFKRVIYHALRRGFAGLVELEHGWTAPGAEIEEAGIAEIRRVELDAAEIGVRGEESG